MENKLKLLSSKMFYIVSGLLLIFYLWSSYKIPYTWDDWYWGIDEGVGYLIDGSLNSRYVGNFFAVVLTRSEVIKTIVMGVVSWLIPIVMFKIVCKDTFRNIPIYLLCNLFPSLLFASTFSQTYGWVAGYVNYVISALFLLVYIYIIRDLFDEHCIKKTGRLKQLGLFFLSVIMQLFLENLAIFMVIVNTILLVYAMYKRYNADRYGVMLLGNVLGTIIMFSSSMYSALFGTGSSLGGIRKLVFSLDDGLYSIVLVFNNMVSVWFEDMLFVNIKFYIVLFTLIVYLAIRNRKTVSRVWNMAFVVPFIGLGYFFISINFGAMLLMVLIILSMGICLYVKDRNLKLKCLTMFVCHVGVIAPLFPIDFESTNQSRLFFTSGVFLMLLIVYIVWHEIGTYGKKVYVVSGIVISLITIVYVGSLIGVYNKIGEDSSKCLSAIEGSKVNGGTLKLEVSRHLEKYVWKAYCVTYENEDWFREFYGLSDSVEVIVDGYEGYDKVLRGDK